jgi:ferredoxin-NADP reductase
MEKELVEGGRVWVKLPYGDFVVDDGCGDVVLFAGGTGITAFTAFLLGLGGPFVHPIYLAYGARNRKLLIYQDLLEKLKDRVPGLKVFYFLEKIDQGEGKGEGKEGYLSVAALWPEIRDPSRSTFYLSGPPLMIKTLSQDLRLRGIDPEAVRIDAWE